MSEEIQEKILKVQDKKDDVPNPKLVNLKIKIRVRLDCYHCHYANCHKGFCDIISLEKAIKLKSCPKWKKEKPPKFEEKREFWEEPDDPNKGILESRW